MVNIEEACTKAKSLCEEITGKELDYSLESLETIEETIQYVRGLHRKGLVDDDVCWNLSVGLGIYAGDIYLKDKLASMDYMWRVNQDGIPVVGTEDGKNAISPITKVYKKLMVTEPGEDGEGSMSNVYSNFLMLMELYRKKIIGE